MRQYGLVRGTSAAAVERMTGLPAIDTPIGTLFKAAPPFDLEYEMAKLNRALHPSPCNCSVIHSPGCPFGSLIT